MPGPTAAVRTARALHRRCAIPGRLRTTRPGRKAVATGAGPSTSAHRGPRATTTSAPRPAGAATARRRGWHCPGRPMTRALAEARSRLPLPPAPTRGFSSIWRHKKTMKVAPHHNSRVANRRMDATSATSAPRRGSRATVAAAPSPTTRFGGSGSPGKRSVHQMQALVAASRHDNTTSSRVSRMPAARLSASETGCALAAVRLLLRRLPTQSSLRRSARTSIAACGVDTGGR